jgi:regulator of sigma E protease
LDQDVAGARVRDRATLITHVLDGSPAQKAGLKEGDELQRIAGHDIAASQEVKPIVQEIGNQDLELVIKRETEVLTVHATPVQLKEIGAWGIGVGMADVGTVSFPLPQAFIAGLKTSWNMMTAILMAFLMEQSL